MSNLLSVLDSMVSDVFPTERRSPLGYGYRSPRVNIDKNKYTFEIDVPGVDKDVLKIELNDDVLSIYTAYEKINDNKEQKREYRFGFRVPDDIDSNQMTAQLKNGVLTIELPKSEEKLPKHIPITIE